MKHHFKLLYAFILIIMLLLSACGSAAEIPETEETAQITEQTTAPTEPTTTTEAPTTTTEAPTTTTEAPTEAPNPVLENVLTQINIHAEYDDFKDSDSSFSYVYDDVASLDYDEKGNVVSITFADWSYYTRLKLEEDANSHQDWLRVDFEYQDGRLMRAEAYSEAFGWDVVNFDGKIGTVEFEYDEQGRVVKVVCWNSIESSSFDDILSSDPKSLVQRLVSWELGLESYITILCPELDEYSLCTLTNEYSYDEEGRIAERIYTVENALDPESENYREESERCIYTYDGNRYAVLEGEWVTREYDEHGLLIHRSVNGSMNKYYEYELNSDGYILSITQEVPAEPGQDPRKYEQKFEYIFGDYEIDLSNK